MLDDATLGSSKGMLSKGGEGRSDGSRCEKIHRGRVQLILSGQGRFWKSFREENIEVRNR